MKNVWRLASWVTKPSGPMAFVFGGAGAAAIAGAIAIVAQLASGSELLATGIIFVFLVVATAILALNLES